MRPGTATRTTMLLLLLVRACPQERRVAARALPVAGGGGIVHHHLRPGARHGGTEEAHPTTDAAGCMRRSLCRRAHPLRTCGGFWGRGGR
eukprot:scaffold1590_cov417-Prasinococcus_capsulatus_cf.AAC.19